MLSQAAVEVMMKTQLFDLPLVEKAINDLIIRNSPHFPSSKGIAKSVEVDAYTMQIPSLIGYAVVKPAGNITILNDGAAFLVDVIIF